MQDRVTTSYVRWRLPVLVSALILILLVPFMLIRLWTGNSQGGRALGTAYPGRSRRPRTDSRR